MLRELTVLLALIATPALAQEPDPARSQKIDEAIAIVRANTTLWPQDWFLQGEGVGLSGETRPRASDAAGVCEWESFLIGSGPDPGPERPRAIEIHAKTNYGLRAVEAEPDDIWSRDHAIAQDAACWDQRGDLHYVGAEHAGFVWTAGQVIEAIARDLRTVQQTRWGCVENDRCPSREQALDIITVANLSSVYQVSDLCPTNDDQCLALDFTDGEGGIWSVTLNPDRHDGHRSAEAQWSWREDVIVD